MSKKTGFMLFLIFSAIVLGLVIYWHIKDPNINIFKINWP